MLFADRPLNDCPAGGLGTLYDAVVARAGRGYEYDDRAIDPLCEFIGGRANERFESDPLDTPFGSEPLGPLSPFAPCPPDSVCAGLLSVDLLSGGRDTERDSCVGRGTSLCSTRAEDPVAGPCEAEPFTLFSGGRATDAFPPRGVSLFTSPPGRPVLRSAIWLFVGGLGTE